MLLKQLKVVSRRKALIMKNLGKALFILGIILFMIPFILGSEYFINIFSISSMICFAVALSIALAEKHICLHAIVTFIVVGICIWSYTGGLLGVFLKTLVLFVVYILALVFMRVRKMILHRTNEKK